MTVEGPGTGDGFAKFCNGESDSSGASRAMKEEEIAVCEQKPASTSSSSRSLSTASPS
jgi:phosphate transport system substrate-binding protein